MGQWLVVHQSLPESHCCAVRCFDKAVDPPVLVCAFRNTSGQMPCASIPLHGSGEMACGIHYRTPSCPNECIASCVPCGIGSFHHPLARVYCWCCWSDHLYIMFRLYCHQPPSNLIPHMPLQDSAVTIHVPSLHIYTAATSWISHCSHAKGG